jgi:hypothetical protein
VFGLVAIILVLIVWRFRNQQRGKQHLAKRRNESAFFGCGPNLAMANLERLRVELATSGSLPLSAAAECQLLILVVAILGLGIVMTGILSQESGSTIIHYLGIPGQLAADQPSIAYPVGFLAQLLYWWQFVSLIRREPPPPWIRRYGRPLRNGLITEMAACPSPWLKY